MSDYIKREDAINAINGITMYRGTIPYDSILFNIYKIQSADVVEVDKVNKIYEKLADLFDTPCNYSPCDEIMLESERCKDDCGDISEAECWRRYFEIVCNGERAEA